MRHREVEIHHADLGAGYAHADWPAPFVGDLLDVVARDQAGSGPFTAVATDLGRSWSVGEGDGPEVRGTGSALGWWLVGRGSGEGVTSDAGLCRSWHPGAARRDAAEAQTSSSPPVATSNTKPRTRSVLGMNGDALIRLPTAGRRRPGQ